MLLVLATAGCPSLQGTVRDTETGEPIAGAEVGVYVLAFAAICAEFQVRSLTDGNGQYSAFLNRPSQTVIVRADGYLESRFYEEMGGFVRTHDFDLQSILTIEGEWDMVFEFENGRVESGQIFTIRGDAIFWSPGFSGDRGDLEYDFDGQTISIEADVFTSCDTAGGSVTATLSLSPDEQTLTGPFTVSPFYFEDCADPCPGTLTGARSEP